MSCYAWQSDTQATIKQDSSVVTVKQFDKDLEQQYNTNDFKYDSTRGEAQNLLSRFIRWVLQGLADTFGIDISPGMVKILEIIIYIGMGLLVIYLLLRFFSGEKLNTLFSKKPATITPFDFQEEHIAQTNFNTLIQQALSEKDYRLAIRYLYLSSLQQLASYHAISWHFRKTNQEYYREIQTPEIKALFKDVSYFFEYIWYGEFPINAASFTQAEQQFNTLHQLIKKHLG